MAVGERESSQPDNASQREGERTVRERTSSVMEKNEKNEIEGVTRHGGMVEGSVQKGQIEQCDEQVRIGEKEEGKTGRVLYELYQNCVGQDSIEVKFKKEGSWKKKGQGKYSESRLRK